MMRGAHIEVLFAAAYALFLVASAAILEMLACRTHRRTSQRHTLGFRYQMEFDRWECPTGHHLHRHQTDPVLRVVRYRAPARTCNTCAVKPACTDSNEGREIERRPEGWLETGIGRFHRGLSLALLVLAALILGIETARFRQERELILLASLLVPILILTARLSAAFLWPATPERSLAGRENARMGQHPDAIAGP